MMFAIYRATTRPQRMVEPVWLHSIHVLNMERQRPTEFPTEWKVPAKGTDERSPRKEPRQPVKELEFSEKTHHDHDPAVWINYRKYMHVSYYFLTPESPEKRKLNGGRIQKTIKTRLLEMAQEQWKLGNHACRTQNCHCYGPESSKHKDSKSKRTDDLWA